MKPSSAYAAMETYPFVKLGEAKARLLEQGTTVFDFGVGEPQEITPQFIVDALKDSVDPRSRYPLAQGLPELREAIADWIGRRYGVEIDPETNVIPTLGSKEAIFHLAQIVGGSTVAVTTPVYPVPVRGAMYAGKKVLELPLLAENDFLPDLDSVDSATWDDTAILWLNYPNNPTAATATPELFEKAAALARKHNFILGSDEAYSELYFGSEAPISALQAGDLTNLAVFNTLSKRSSMPGYRSGFIAGDPELITALKRYRPNVGVAPQEFVQRASVAAWGDEQHVSEVRDLYRAKRDIILPVFERNGFHHVGGDATFFLWLKAPGNAREAAELLLEEGVILAPGHFFGSAGKEYIRLALVATLTECEQAAQIIDKVLTRQYGTANAH